MTFATIDELRANLGGGKKAEVSAAYAAKMLHDLPPGAIVDRTVFLLQKVAGKRVLEFGASGPMHEGIVKAAAFVVGVDRETDGQTVIGFDLDDVSRDLPDTAFSLVDAAPPDVIICGEVLEHLANPGWFLQRLRAHYAGVPVIITVPNAYTTMGRKYLKDGRENVNIDHVAWYSPRTLRTLLERYGYAIREFAYYNGTDGPSAEGLIAVVE